MPTATMTLQEKVHAIVFAGDNVSLYETADKQPGGQVQLNEFEMDLRDWGTVFGVAVGLARTEEPCESLESVAQRALEAAWPVWLESNSGFKKADRDELVTAVVKAYRKAAESGKLSVPEYLEDALAELHNKAGA